MMHTIHHRGWTIVVFKDGKRFDASCKPHPDNAHRWREMGALTLSDNRLRTRSADRTLRRAIQAIDEVVDRSELRDRVKAAHDARIGL